MNFFGYLDQSDLDFLESSIQPRSNHTFILSHYPSGTLIKGTSSKGSSFPYVTRNVSVWFSGHLHKLIGGLGNTMYSNEANRYLELELGDMKSNAMFRVVAVDHDVISFIDLPVQVPEPSKTLDSALFEHRPPVILITYPKDGRFLITHREGKTKLDHSRYIRFLAWSSSDKMDFVVRIDGIQQPNLKPKYSGRGKSWKTGVPVNASEYIPLWTIAWDPSKYKDGKVHILTVEGTQSNGKSGSHTIHFRHDGELIPEMDAGSGGFIISVRFDAFVSLECFTHRINTGSSKACS